MSDETNSEERHRNRPGVAGPDENGMSRYLLCIPCREEVRDENEPDKVVLGVVKLTEASCDRCSEALPVGTQAAAASFYQRPEHYRPWEHERLALDALPSRQETALHTFGKQIRALCNRITGGDKEQVPERDERSQQPTTEPGKRNRDRGHEW